MNFIIDMHNFSIYDVKEYIGRYFPEILRQTYDYRFLRSKHVCTQKVISAVQRSSNTHQLSIQKTINNPVSTSHSLSLRYYLHSARKRNSTSHRLSGMSSLSPKQSTLPSTVVNVNISKICVQNRQGAR